MCHLCGIKNCKHVYSVKFLGGTTYLYQALALDSKTNKYCLYEGLIESSTKADVVRHIAKDLSVRRNAFLCLNAVEEEDDE